MTRLQNGRPIIGVRFSVAARDVSLFPNVLRGCGALLVSYSSSSENSLPGEKLPGQEGDKSSPPTAEVKNEWSYTSTNSHGVIARTGITLPLPLPCYLKQNTLHLYSKDLSVNDVKNLEVASSDGLVQYQKLNKERPT